MTPPVCPAAAPPARGRGKAQLPASHTLLLHSPARAGLVDVLDRLIERGAPLEAVDGQGLTALHAAAAAGKHRAVQRLLDAGADHTARTPAGATPLHLAADCSTACSGLCAAALLKGGAGATAENSAGRTPLQVCATAPYAGEYCFGPEVVRGVVRTVAWLHSGVHVYAALLEASDRAHVRHHVQANEAAAKRMLLRLCKTEHARAVRKLLAAGCDPNAVATEGASAHGDGGQLSALQIALHANQPGVAAALLQAGAEPNLELPALTLTGRAKERAQLRREDTLRAVLKDIVPLARRPNELNRAAVALALADERRQHRHQAAAEEGALQATRSDLAAAQARIAALEAQLAVQGSRKRRR